ncbi:hypothetical protein Hdeb2414_s0022g00620321 [Helianthus debilis subsp. tardiflorus]
MAFPSQSLILHPASQSVHNNGSRTKEARRLLICVKLCFDCDKVHVSLSPIFFFLFCSRLGLLLDN